jgi:hypothetical protein
MTCDLGTKLKLTQNEKYNFKFHKWLVDGKEHTKFPDYRLTAIPEISAVFKPKRIPATPIPTPVAAATPIATPVAAPTPTRPVAPESVLVTLYIHGVGKGSVYVENKECKPRKLTRLVNDLQCDLGTLLTLTANANSENTLKRWTLADQGIKYIKRHELTGNVTIHAYFEPKRPTPIPAVATMPTDTPTRTPAASSPIPESINVTAVSTDINVGQTQQFRAMVTYNDGQEKDLAGEVTWKSSDTRTVSIDVVGLATGVAEGTAKITASLEQISSQSVTLTVTSTNREKVKVNYTVKPPGSGQVLVKATPGQLDCEKDKTKQYALGMGSYSCPSDSYIDIIATRNGDTDYELKSLRVAGGSSIETSLRPHIGYTLRQADVSVTATFERQDADGVGLKDGDEVNQDKTDPLKK